ncbi:MAG: dTMP kinase [Candidatus Bipolaricaulota bacterium]
MARIDLAGRLIVLEGLDFTGKSTQVRLLGERLRRAGYDPVVTGEPGGTPVGDRARHVLLDPIYRGTLTPLSELLLFMVSRSQHVREVVLPALSAGKVVLSSRYRLSSLAYQGYGRGIDLEMIRRLNDLATEGREADLTFLLDVPVEIALGRRRGEPDRIEGEESAFYERVRRGFLELTAGDATVVRVDGTLEVRDLAETLAAALGL